MNIRKIVSVLLMLVMVLSISFAFPACSSSGDVGGGDSDTSSSSESGDEANITISVEYDDDDMDTSTSAIDMTSITLEGNSVSFSGSGITVDGSIVTIAAAGMYSINGTLIDGQIIVDTEDEETVKLVLQGVDITCSTSAPIYVVNAEKTVITLADGTENFITDGGAYIYDDPSSDDPNAAIFSKDDLTINGSGYLELNANNNNGIASKDDLKITGGNIDINAVNDGIKGRDCVAISDGDITINAGGDGIQSNNDEDAEKGFVYIEGGTINITADRDGIQAETSAVITGGTITISSGGGSNGVSSTNSTKGIKAETATTITGGIISIDSCDDSIHSNNSLTIDGGDIVLASGDDGIHSDSTLVINGGDINITECYEGIESAVITINNGTIHLVSSDDGINASSGEGDSFGGGPGQGSSGTNKLYINGGYIAVDSLGDGLDINGSAYMTGGTVIINGPTRNDNGALDGTFVVNGGFLVAVGSSGMAESPSESSTQDYVHLTFGSQQSAGTIFHLETEDGEEVLTFSSSKTYQSVVVCSAKLEEGSTYVAYYGGSSTGTVIDGVYSGGTYTPGSEGYSFTL